MIYVLDACALIAFLRQEPGADVVEGLLLDPNNECSAHVINLCEVYYDFIRASDKPTAESAIEDLKLVGVLPREDVDEVFWKEAGKYKANIRKVSLADCFAIALTNRDSGTLVTSDHREFDPIAAAGICQVLFIR